VLFVRINDHLGYLFIFHAYHILQQLIIVFPRINTETESEASFVSDRYDLALFYWSNVRTMININKLCYVP